MDLVAQHDPLDEKLSRPVFWGKLAGLKFQELQPALFEESLELIRSFLIPEEVMCVGLGVGEDPESLDDLVENAQHCMRDGSSIVVVDEEEDEEDEEECGGVRQRVVAVMVARVVQQREHMRSFSRIKIARGEAYGNWLELRCHLQKKADLFNEFQIDKYYRIYHIVVHPDFRRKGVATFLVRLAVERLTRLFAGRRRSLCTAVAPSRASQLLFTRQGFRPQVVMYYHEWRDEAGRQLIDNVGVGNYSVVLLVYEVGEAGEEEGDDGGLDLSPLTNPAEEPEPEIPPPTEFPGRELDRKPPRPPAADCRALPELPASRLRGPHPQTLHSEENSCVSSEDEEQEGP